MLHEFSSLAGVREDVTDMVLNVKQIALKMEGEGPKRLQLNKTGPGEVTAGDIAVSGDIRFRYKVRPIDQDIKEQSERPCRLVKANQWSLYH